MAEKVKPYKDSDLGKKEQVTKMFDNISIELVGISAERPPIEMKLIERDKEQSINY